MDIQSEEGLNEFFRYIQFNSDDIQITLGTCSQIFNTLANPLFRPIYQSNKHIEGGVAFYKTMFDQVKTVNSYPSLQEMIVFMFYTNGSSEFFVTNSILVFSCMKMVINYVWQQCLKYTPRKNIVGSLILTCEKETMHKLMISEFKYIIKCIETERGITFPDPNKDPSIQGSFN